MKNILLLLSVFGLISCKTNVSGQVVIKQFYPYPKLIDTAIIDNKMAIEKTDYFLIQNYKDDDNINNQIDSFVYKNIPLQLNRYRYYQMYFYKETKYTNEKKIRENPRELDRYSQFNDLLFEYSWDSGEFNGRFKFKNGAIVSEKPLPKFTIKKTDD